MNRRAFVALSSAAALATPSLLRAQDGPLFVNTYGGPWEAAARKHLFEPFTAETGIEVQLVSGVSLTKLATQVRTRAYEFDVMTLGAQEIYRAYQNGLSDPAEEHFPGGAPWDGAFVLNGVPSHMALHMIVNRSDRFPGGGPQNWTEFWDVERFPGARTMQNFPLRVLAYALLADGVAPADLFPYDIDRAFASLDSIKPHVRVWWNQGPQAQQLLNDGEVETGAIWYSTARVLAREGVPVDLVWNQGVMDPSYWVVAKGSPRSEKAWRFVEFAVRPEVVGAFSATGGYGPMNPGAFDALPKETVNTLINYPGRIEPQIIWDPVALGPQIDEIIRRWDAWQAN